MLRLQRLHVQGWLGGATGGAGEGDQVAQTANVSDLRPNDHSASDRQRLARRQRGRALADRAAGQTILDQTRPKVIEQCCSRLRSSSRRAKHAKREFLSGKTSEFDFPDDPL